MNDVSVTDRTGKSPRFAKLLHKVLSDALGHLHQEKSSLSVALITDREIQSLNRKYRKKNRPTDVLSFSQNITLPSGKILLGDIVISTPTARRQAKKVGHPAEIEFATLAIHGLLHLLGYDHEEEAEAKTMFHLQRRLLERVQIV